MREYKIQYEAEGSKKFDWTLIQAENIAGAISIFERTEIKNYHTSIIYTECAIKSITIQGV